MTLLTNRKLRKITNEEILWVGGVCAGVSYWLGIPTWIVRLVWTCSVLFFGMGVVLYILLWIFMPKWDEPPQDYKEITGG